LRSYPDDVDERELIAALTGAWTLDVKALAYVPEGGGGYHWSGETHDGRRWFLTVDDLGVKPWLGHQPDEVFASLAGAFNVALALQEQVGCEFVVAPIRTRSASSLHRLSARYSLAVFPFVDGQPREWGTPFAGAERTRLLRLLAGLHRATPKVEAHAARRGRQLPGRIHLEAALDQLDRPWRGGPFGEPARAALASKADVVRVWLSTFDDLSAEVHRLGRALVVTHGEPHPANFIRSGPDMFLIDWDTVGPAHSSPP